MRRVAQAYRVPQDHKAHRVPRVVPVLKGLRAIPAPKVHPVLLALQAHKDRQGHKPHRVPLSPLVYKAIQVCTVGI